MVSADTLTAPAAPASKVKIEADGLSAVTSPSTCAQMSASSTATAMAIPRFPFWKTAVSAIVWPEALPVARSCTEPFVEVADAVAPKVRCATSFVTPITTVSA